MKKFVSSATAFLASVSMAIAPAQAREKKYSPELYDLFLDCASLYLLIASNEKDEKEQEDMLSMSQSFVGSAAGLSGIEPDDVSELLTPRINRIVDWIDDDDPKLSELSSNCAAVLAVGIAYSDE